MSGAAAPIQPPPPCRGPADHAGWKRRRVSDGSFVEKRRGKDVVLCEHNIEKWKQCTQSLSQWVKAINRGDGMVKHFRCAEICRGVMGRGVDPLLDMHLQYRKGDLRSHVQHPTTHHHGMMGRPTGRRGTILADRYYIPAAGLSNEDRLCIETQLTFLVPQPKRYGGDGNTDEVRYWELIESNGLYAVPRFWGIHTFGAPETSHLTAGAAMNADCTFVGALDPHRKQPEAVQTVMRRLGVAVENGWLPENRPAGGARDAYGGGIIGMECGSGKTITSLYCAWFIGNRTGVICEARLLDQWEGAIRQVMPTARIGRLHQDTVVYKDCDFVLISWHSVAKGKYGEDIMSTLGTVIFDEAHHYPAPSLSNASGFIIPKVILALSATPSRIDTLRSVLPFLSGALMFSCWSDAKNVHCLRLRCSLARQKTDIMIRNEANPAVTLNVALKDTLLFDVHAAIIVMLAKSGRNILALSERVEHLEGVQRIINATMPNATTLVYVSGTSDADRAKADDTQIILSTYKMWAEGKDKPALDTVVFLTPCPAPRTCGVQCLGRMLRDLEGKLPPLAILCETGILSYRVEGVWAECQRRGYTMWLYSDQPPINPTDFPPCALTAIEDGEMMNIAHPFQVDAGVITGDTMDLIYSLDRREPTWKVLVPRSHWPGGIEDDDPREVESGLVGAGMRRIVTAPPPSAAAAAARGAVSSDFVSLKTLFTAKTRGASSAGVREPHAPPVPLAQQAMTTHHDVRRGFADAISKVVDESNMHITSTSTHNVAGRTVVPPPMQHNAATNVMNAGVTATVRQAAAATSASGGAIFKSPRAVVQTPRGPQMSTAAASASHVGAAQFKQALSKEDYKTLSGACLRTFLTSRSSGGASGK